MASPLLEAGPILTGTTGLLIILKVRPLYPWFSALFLVATAILTIVTGKMVMIKIQAMAIPIVSLRARNSPRQP
jgi:hypothetical protein